MPFEFAGTEFEVWYEVGVDQGRGEVYANFYSIDPATGLPPAADVGFLPPEDGSGRGQGCFTYLVKPLPGLSPGTEIRNVAEITFDFGETVATNQIDPHDPNAATDPDKEALNTIAAETALVTLSSTAGGSVIGPGEGGFVYDFATTVPLVASPETGFEFVEWIGDVEGIADTTSATTELVAYTDFTLQAVFYAVAPVPTVGRFGAAMFAVLLLLGGTYALRRIRVARGG